MDFVVNTGCLNYNFDYVPSEKTIFAADFAILCLIDDVNGN